MDIILKAGIPSLPTVTMETEQGPQLNDQMMPFWFTLLLCVCRVWSVLCVECVSVCVWSVFVWSVLCEECVVCVVCGV